MLWIKAFHIIFVVTWFAGLFYLPRLFVYHAMTKDAISNEQFKVMERKLFYGITTPSAILTVGFGVWLLVAYWWDAFLVVTGVGWLHLKIVLVLILIVYHIYCGKFLNDFKQDRNHHSHTFYRWFNEFPVLILIVVMILVEVQPF
ncbi:CopD family protein [Candidatus Parabeggiatoa sp. HSG14]|uniref:CopD family protein n=1 Tax=Candidatus Parabeggiatoa sp. HSG14 TaxID=3055593 RepID=UPI0025A7BD83|nr:CopD family protein [Thiotrichales bacterium HSG14]